MGLAHLAGFHSLHTSQGRLDQWLAQMALFNLFPSIFTTGQLAVSNSSPQPGLRERQQADESGEQADGLIQKLPQLGTLLVGSKNVFAVGSIPEHVHRPS